MSNDNPNASHGESQCAHILAALQQGDHLTPIDALNRFDCFRLGARIHDLKAKGNEIMTTIIRTQSGKRVASYSLITPRP